MRVAQLRAAAGFAAGIYLERARVLWAARVRHDLFSQLGVQPPPLDPYPIYEQMRRQGPLLPTRLGNLSSTSYAICREIVRSRQFGVTPTEPGPPSPRDFLDLSLLNLNPPDHTRIRRLAGPAFTPRRLESYAVLVEKAVHRVLDDAERRGHFDLMSTVATPLPIAVITELLGLTGDPVRLRQQGSTIAKALDGVWSMRQARALAVAERELRHVFDDLVAEKAAHPDGDLTSVLVAELGESITAEELGPLVRLLLIAGFETTVNAIGTGIRWLLTYPDQWAKLTEDPGLAPQVTEEVLRFDPPVQTTARVAMSDVEVAGHPVRTDQWVITLLAAANRDPEVFARPDRFDITRDRPAEHLAFSGGIHYCLGAPLARMELTLTFRALAERFPRLRFTGPVRMRAASTLRGPLEVPLAVS